jgi:hypothetical protein
MMRKTTLQKVLRYTQGICSDAWGGLSFSGCVQILVVSL